MSPKQFQRYLNRDRGCLHCGEVDAVSPQHRANRGMGGSKARDVPSNVIVFCSWMNSKVESDAYFAEMARTYGWKLGAWSNPATSPVFDAQLGLWFLLDDAFGRVETEAPESELMF